MGLTVPFFLSSFWILFDTLFGCLSYSFCFICGVGKRKEYVEQRREHKDTTRGICRERAWNMYGVCVECGWNARGVSIACAWNVHRTGEEWCSIHGSTCGLCIEYAGICVESSWSTRIIWMNLHGVCMEHAWNMYWYAWSVHVAYVANEWAAPGICNEYVWNYAWNMRGRCME